MGSNPAAEARAYREHMQRVLGRDFNEFAKGVASQSLIQQQLGRIARVEFLADKRPSCSVFHDANELQSFLDDREAASPQGAECRELYLLEDLGRANIEVLGSRLRIPPEVFALHWEKEVAPVNRKTLRLNRYHNISLRYPVMHYLSEKIGAHDAELPPGLYIDRINNVPRKLQLVDDDGNMGVSMHQVSFWSNAESFDGPWTALLLIDPVLRELRLESSLFEDVDAELECPSGGFEPPILRLLPVYCGDGSPLPRLVDLHPFHGDIGARDVSVGMNEPPSSSTFPNFACMFDDLVQLYEDEKLRTGIGNTGYGSPLCTCIPLVSRYVAWLMRGWVQMQRARYWELYDKLHFACYSPGKSATTGSSTSWFQSWGLGKWRAETFRRLTFGSFKAELLAEDIEFNMRVLGVTKPAFSALDEEGTEIWQAVADSTAGLQRKFGALLAAYAQEASIYESQVANRQARNVGRLTALATVLVPISISAAIFSMGGEYLAGESKFWVFWAVSLPVVLVFTLSVFTKAFSWPVEVFTLALERGRVA